jgi:hypothetical protein
MRIDKTNAKAKAIRIARRAATFLRKREAIADNIYVVKKGAPDRQICVWKRPTS